MHKMETKDTGAAVAHEIAPVYDNRSKILILGSFPSVKSREMGFFYGHPQNRFWKLLAELFNASVPVSIDEKRTLLLHHHVALWDVIASCRITGSSDSSIKDVIPNDFSELMEKSSVSRIFANGGTAWKLYEKYIYPQTGIHAEKLPSTSPANAACNLNKLKDSWKVILEVGSIEKRI